MTTPSDPRFPYDLETELDAEIALATSGTSELELPLAQWQFDPSEAEREEVGLRNLRGAVDLFGHERDASGGPS